jgi:hypothetical protein
VCGARGPSVASRDRTPRDGSRTVVSSPTTRCPGHWTNGAWRKRQDSNLRGARAPCGVAHRCHQPLGHASMIWRKKGGSNSQGARALGGFRDRCRRQPSACSSMTSGMPGDRTRSLAVKSRLLCRTELPSHDVRARAAGFEPAPFPVEAGCSSVELRADGQPWNRTRSFLHVRQALYR